jgi:hypothetical protein
MRNSLFIAITLLTLSFCSESQTEFSIEPLKQTVNSNEVTSIELIEIEHPMLGGILNSNILNGSRTTEFLEDLENMKLDGPYIARTNYVIRINLRKDTLRLKTNGTLIANREKDIYYNLTDKQNIIEKYWGKK